MNKNLEVQNYSLPLKDIAFYILIKRINQDIAFYVLINCALFALKSKFDIIFQYQIGKIFKLIFEKVFAY